MNTVPFAPHIIPHWTRGATVYVNSPDDDYSDWGLSPEFADALRARDEELARRAAIERRAADEDGRNILRKIEGADAARPARCREIGESDDEPLTIGRYYRRGSTFVDLVCEAREHELLTAFRELRLSEGAVARLSDLVGGDDDGDLWAVDAEGLGRMLRYLRSAYRWHRMRFGGSLFYDPRLWIDNKTHRGGNYNCSPQEYGRRPAGRPARREIRAILDAWADAGGDESVWRFHAFLRRHVRVSHLRFLKADMVRPLLKAIRTTQAGRLEPPAPSISTKATKAKGKPRNQSARSKAPKVVPLFRAQPTPPPSFGPFDGAA